VGSAAFKAVVGSLTRLQVGSIPIHSRSGLVPGKLTQAVWGVSTAPRLGRPGEEWWWDSLAGR
jgi:hypothetical protein